jgi:hypothetical protein
MEAAQDTMGKETDDRRRSSWPDPPSSRHLPTDSMITVPLSEAGSDGTEQEEEDTLAKLQRPAITVEEKRLSSRPTSTELLQALREPRDSDASIDTAGVDSPTISLSEERTGRGRSNSDGSDHSAHVDWAELEKKEEQEPQEKGQDEVTTCPVRMMLGRA